MTSLHGSNYGFSCGKCGAWVAPGFVHVCGHAPVTYTRTPTPDDISAALSRIEALLQQILNRLDGADGCSTAS